MEAEANSFIEEMSLKETTTSDRSIWPCPSKTFEGKRGEIEVIVVTNGKSDKFNCCNVGTTPAAISTFAAISRYNPDIILNAGTAGGFNRVGGRIGDVYLSNHFTHHDRRIQIPGYVDYAMGNHRTIPVTQVAKALGFKTGTVSTSNSLDYTDTDMLIMIDNNAHVKDMEAASIAWVVEHCSPSLENGGIPFFALKVITDIVDGGRPTHEEFLENLQKAGESLQNALLRIIDHLAHGVEVGSL